MKNEKKSQKMPSSSDFTFFTKLNKQQCCDKNKQKKFLSGNIIYNSQSLLDFHYISDNHLAFNNNKENIELLSFKEEVKRMMKKIGDNYFLFNKNIENINILFEESDKYKKTVVILTQKLNGWGDISAARKLIICLKKRCPELRVNWLIEVSSDETISEEILSCADEVLVVGNNSISQYLLSKWSNLFNHAVMVVHFPTPVHLTNTNLIEVVMLDKVKDIFVTEYDLVPTEAILEYKTKESVMTPEDKSTRQEMLFTGFSSASLGIFLEEFLVVKKEQIMSQLKDEQILNFLGKFDPQTYHKEHAFFFGYFSGDERVQNHVNGISFCTLIAAYTQQQKLCQSQLDIVCSFSQDQLKEFNPKVLFKYNVNEVHICSSDGKAQVFENSKPTQNGRVVRILSQFRVSGQNFKLLLQLAYYSALEAKIMPIIGCTGDQSLSEVLSLPGAVPFYEVMLWKQELAVQLFLLVKVLLYDDFAMRSKGGENCAIYFKSMVVKKEQQFQITSVEFIETMLCYLPNIFCMQKIHDYLKEEKNLEKTLVKKIIEIINTRCPGLLPEPTEFSHKTSLSLKNV